MFYGNRRPEDAPFLGEMWALEREDAHFTFILTMSELEKSHLPGTANGASLNQQILLGYLPGITSATYFLTGPSTMVRGLRTVLMAAGVDNVDIRIEEFTGY